MSDRFDRRRYLKTVGAVGAIGLAGCTGGDDGGESTDTTTMDSTTTGEATTTKSEGGKVRYLSDRGGREIWEAAIQEFNAGSDYTVEVTWLPKGTSMNEQIQKMKAAGNLPEIVFETSTDAYRETLDGKTAPVTDLVSSLGTKDPVRYQGDSYLLPAVTIPLMGVYRSDVVQGDPRTRSEWLSEAERIHSSEGMGGLIMPSGRTNNATTQVNQNLWNGGTNIYEGPAGDISVSIDQGANKEAAVGTYQWMKDMAQFNPNTSGWEWGDVINAFVQEQAAAALTIGGLTILQVAANRPELAGNLKAMPFPLPEGGEQNHWWAYTEGFYLYNEATNVDGAREFLDFFMQSDYYLNFIKQTPLFNFPTTLDQVQSDSYQNVELVQNHQDLVNTVIDNWDHMRPVLATGDDGAPNLIAAKAYGNQLMGQSADQLIAGDKSAEETVTWIADQLRALK